MLNNDLNFKDSKNPKEFLESYLSSIQMDYEQQRRRRSSEHY